MQKWEYKHVYTEMYEEDLNELGRLGWELIAHVKNLSASTYVPLKIFKRPLVENRYVTVLCACGNTHSAKLVL